LTGKKESLEAAGTRDRALQAAERLFVAHGYEGTSLRAIAGAAKVNLGSLVYYFGTKDGLFRNLCEERLSGIIAAQMEGLRACEARLDAGEAVSLEELLRALIAPSLPQAAARTDLRGLYALVFTDPSEVVLAIGHELFVEPSRLVYRLVRRLLPDIDSAEFHWRYVGALGSLVVTQGFAERMSAMMGVPQPDMPIGALIDVVIGVVARGLRS
jgi:AcrR family transcriptional regulator